MIPYSASSRARVPGRPADAGGPHCRPPFIALPDRTDRRRLIVRLELARCLLVAALPLVTGWHVFSLYPVLTCWGASRRSCNPPVRPPCLFSRRTGGLGGRTRWRSVR